MSIRKKIGPRSKKKIVVSYPASSYLDSVSPFACTIVLYGYVSLKLNIYSNKSSVEKNSIEQSFSNMTMSMDAFIGTSRLNK